MSKKNTHIDVKDNGIKLANGIGDELSNLSHSLELHISKKLSEGTDNVRTWQIKQNNAIREFKSESGKIVNDTKKNIKEKIKNDDTVNLNSKQAKRIATEVNDGALLLQSNAIRTWENTKNKILTTLRVNSATSLKDEVAKHIDSGLKLDVVYKDGREYKFDTYFEMKARTDIQKDIADNMIKAGQAGGVVFYIAAYFGDCAKDHVDYQGKIYVDEKWESIAPKDRIEEIREYINSNNIMTVQDVVTEKGNFLTSRPNCRHYFQYVDIDSVIGAKTESDVSKLRDQMNLNFNGKYRPEKYEALQKQRLNERKIRAEKQEIEKQELELHLKPGNKAIQSKILAGEANVRRYQAEQRDLIKQYNNLERSYDREALGNRVSMGAIANNLTYKSNSGTMKLGESVLFRKATSNKDFKYLTDKQFDSLIISAVKDGFEYERGTEFAKAMIGNNSAATIADYMFFGDKVRRVDVYEEIYHCRQYRDNKFFGMKHQDTLLEIDAKEYLLKNAKKFKLPRNEILETKELLEYYKNELRRMEENDS